MNDVERALSEIADIRAHLAASTRFRGIAPEANALTCVLSLVVALAQTIWPHTLAQGAFRYVSVWAAATIASAVIVGVEAVSRTRRLHGIMSKTMLGTAIREALPFAAAALVISIVICCFSAETIWMLPGLWQILIGLLGFSVLPAMPRAIVWVAGWYFLCGSAVLAMAGWSGTLTPWMMGLPLIIGQGAVAIILRQANGERDGQT